MSKREFLTTSIVIPTYRRPKALVNCVASIMAGARLPEEIVIVGREGDSETEHAIRSLDFCHHPQVQIRSAWVTTPGHIPPVETGARAVSTDLVAILDDDVCVTSEWLGSLLRPFANPSVGVVGGRVLLPGAPPPKLKGKPGCVSWYGKHWGNIGSVDGQAAFEVDSVMEGNCVWQRNLLVSLEFDSALNFDDSPMYGLDLCLQAKARGFKVIYEPRAAVYHYPATRPPGLGRQELEHRLFSYCRNYTYIILKRLPKLRHPFFFAWWFLIGERGAWGLASLLADNIQSGWHKRRSVAQAWRGKTEGIRIWLNHSRAQKCRHIGAICLADIPADGAAPEVGYPSGALRHPMD